MKRILDADASSVMTFNEHDDKFTIVQSTDVSAALDYNNQLRSAGLTKTKDGDHFAASIPLELLAEYAQKRGLPADWTVIANDNVLLDQFLNDPDYKKCRIHEGKI